MDAFKISVKFFVEDPSHIGERDFVPIFHSWIQTHAVPEHLLIDVADYAHVHNGPGTVLIAHEANFYADRTDGRLGLTYSRKQPVAGTFIDGLRQAFAAALDACARLENESQLAGKIRFDRNEAIVRINDRLLAPNTQETLDAFRREAQPALQKLFGGDVRIEHVASPKKLFEVHITAANSPAPSQ